MAAHTLETFPWKVGVHAYVVNAYVNGNIVESHFKAVRSKKGNYISDFRLREKRKTQVTFYSENVTFLP